MGKEAGIISNLALQTGNGIMSEISADALVLLLANLSHEQCKAIFWKKCPMCDPDTRQKCYNCRRQGIVMTDLGIYLESRMESIAETEAERERDRHENCYH